MFCSEIYYIGAGGFTLYIGSVRFFKHLIVCVVCVLIIVPTVLAIMFGIENNKKNEEINALSSDKQVLTTMVSYYNGDATYTAEELYDIITTVGIPCADIVDLLYEKQPDAFAELLARIDAQKTAFTTLDNSIDATPVNNTTASEITTDSSIIIDTSDTEDVSADIPDDVTTVPETSEVEELPEYASLFPTLYVDLPPITAYNDDENYVYLTFDDGPSNYTENLLYYLDKYNIKATFFVIPKDTNQSFRLMKKIVDEGHTIGVHSLTHVYEDIYASVDNFLADFEAAYNLIYEATGVEPTLYRFPGGSKNDYNTATRDAIITEMTRRGFVYFDWNVDSEDAIGANWTQMYNNVLSEVENNKRSVILMHDGYQNTVLVLEDIIKALQTDSKNYTFDKLTRDVRPMQF